MTVSQRAALPTVIARRMIYRRWFSPMITMNWHQRMAQCDLRSACARHSSTLDVRLLCICCFYLHLSTTFHLQSIILAKC